VSTGYAAGIGVFWVGIERTRIDVGVVEDHVAVAADVLAKESEVSR